MIDPETTRQILCVGDEVWLPVDGASICTITEQDYQALADGKISTADLRPVNEIVLRQQVQGGPFKSKAGTRRAKA